MMNSRAFDHRKSYTKLHITGADRAPLANKRVRIEQRRHSFLFGIGAFDTVELAGSSLAPLPEERRARLEDLLDKIFALCNYA
ncbi:MAG: hypothetical protein LBB61_00665, partial [Treponema sp.]|nr:hypothetical protein [Treponema sp.]